MVAAGIPAFFLGAMLVLSPSLGEHTTQAEQPAAGEVRYEDKAGDVAAQAHVNALTTPLVVVPSDQFAYVDLIEAWVGKETNTSFILGATFAKWEQPSGPLGAAAARTVEWFFRFGGSSYAVIVPGNQTCGGHVRTWDEGPARYRTTGCAAKMEDPGRARLEVAVEKAAVTDKNGAAFRQHQALTEILVMATAYDQTSSSSSYSVGMNVTDRAPDTGHRGPFRSEKGSDKMAGDLLLTTPEPVRASNGESTTIVYPVTLVNNGPHDRLVVLSTTTAEESFSVRAPARLRVAANGATNFPVILTMGFTHRHGDVGQFTISVQDISDEAHQAFLILGVHWLEVPQPSGHHKQLWLHTAPGHGSSVFWVSPRIWMNAAQKDPNPATTDEEVFPDSGLTIGADVWRFALQPGLRIGLAFDRNQTGGLTLQIKSPLPRPASIVNATMYWDCSQEGFAPSPACPKQGYVVVGGGQSGPKAMDAGAATTFEVPLRLYTDVLPYIQGSRLFVDAVLRGGPTTSFGPYASPRLVPKGSSLQLPLMEYHDPVADEFLAVGTLRLTAQGKTDRPLNAGEVVQFALEVEHTAQGPDTIALSMVGFNSEWATLHGPAQLHVKPGEKVRVMIAVQAPADAQPGERAELFLVAESAYDASVVAVLRLRATVVDEAMFDAEDESSLLPAPPPRGSSGFVLAWALAGIAVIVAVRASRGPSRPQP